MDSPKFNRPWAPEMPGEENSQGTSAASQSISEALIKNLSNLTLDPSTKFSSLVLENPPQQQDGENLERLDEGVLYRRRRGVRTLLTARKVRMERMIQVIKFRYLTQLPQIQREGRLNGGWQGLDVAVIIACIIEIFLRILAQRIATQRIIRMMRSRFS
ncbi:hypothetical protein MC885_019692, partial [Smutsia gigantea]